MNRRSSVDKQEGKGKPTLSSTQRGYFEQIPTDPKARSPKHLASKQLDPLHP